MDGLSDAEAMIVTGLMRECKEHERRDTFFPAFAGCSVCGGRIYAQTTDVAKQLGVCGCAVAFEMEYGAATARCAVTAPSPYQEPSKEAQLALLTALQLLNLTDLHLTYPATPRALLPFEVATASDSQLPQCSC